jgi:hypothetical protein
MRTFLRTLAATAALTAVVLGAGASTAFAASDNGSPAGTYREVRHDEWCFDDGAIEYCTVQDTAISWTFAPSGGAVIRIHNTNVVTMFDEGGARIGETTSRSLSRSIWTDAGQKSEFNLSHNRFDGPGGGCSYVLQVKIVGYEVVLDRFLGPDCA